MNELHDAIRSGELEDVIEQLTDPGSVNKPHTITGEYPIFIAAIGDFPDILTHLKSHGALIPDKETDPDRLFQQAFVDAYHFYTITNNAEPDEIDEASCNKAIKALKPLIKHWHQLPNIQAHHHAWLAKLHEMLGDCYAGKNDFEKAIHHYKAAIHCSQASPLKQDWHYMHLSTLYALSAKCYEKCYMREEASIAHMNSIDCTRMISDLFMRYLFIRITYAQWETLYLHESIESQFIRLAKNFMLCIATIEQLTRFVTTLLDEEQAFLHPHLIRPLIQFLQITLVCADDGYEMRESLRQFLTDKTMRRELLNIITALENYASLIESHPEITSSTRHLEILKQIQQISAASANIEHRHRTLVTETAHHAAAFFTQSTPEIKSKDESTRLSDSNQLRRGK